MCSFNEYLNRLEEFYFIGIFIDDVILVDVKLLK